MPNSSFITYEHGDELHSLERDQIEAELEWLPENRVTGNFLGNVLARSAPASAVIVVCVAITTCCNNRAYRACTSNNGWC